MRKRYPILGRRSLAVFLVITLIIASVSAIASTIPVSNGINYSLNKSSNIESNENELPCPCSKKTGQQNTRISNDKVLDQSNRMQITLSFSKDDLSIQSKDGYDFLSLPECSYTRKPGNPTIPYQIIRLALPSDMVVETVEIIEMKTTILKGNYLLEPHQGVRTFTDRSPHTFIEPNTNIYSSNTYIPNTIVEFQYQTDLAGQPMAVLHVYPAQWMPNEKKIRFTNEITIEIQGISGYICGDYLPQQITNQGQNLLQTMAEDMVYNPDMVELTSYPGIQRLNVPSGIYDYVIITDQNWVDDFEPLSLWKTQKGTPATIVSTDWIYSEYMGSNNAEKIRSFIQDAHNNWGSMFFLLGGDTNVIPVETRYYHLFLSGEWKDIYVPYDTYYGNIDSDDWTVEVHVGRASVRNAGEISTFINKVLIYEQNPPAYYPHNVALFGFDTDSQSHGEDCKETIDNLYLDGWTTSTVYDSDGGYHLSNVLSTLDAGQNLVNHIDHGSTYSMGAGSQHGWYLDVDDMDDLSNGDKQSILYTIACHVNHFDVVECISEHFVHNPNGGGVAFIGNTRYGIYTPGSAFCTTLSNLYDKYFFRSLLQQNHYRLGEAYTDHKNDGPTGDDYERYVYHNINLLGDPEMPVWTTDPESLSVIHDDDVEINQLTDFPVQVTSEGDPVLGATVCLYKEDDVYEIATTDINGVATFWFAPAEEGTLSVTVTKHNYLPHVSDAECYDSVGPYTLTLLVQGNGTVIIDPPEGPYPRNTTVTLTANPDTGWCFYEWQNSLSGSDNPISLLMNRNKIVTAVFERDCNDNGIPDYIDIQECDGSPGCSDCNDNGIPDECDIASGYSQDCQQNGIPDECDLLPPDYVQSSDECAEASLVCPNKYYYGDTTGATNDGSSSCGDSDDTADVWYYYEPYGSGLGTFSLLGSSYDTVLSIHSGCPGTVDNEIACSDDYSGQASYITMVVSNGVGYWIRISGKNGETGAYQFRISGPSCPPTWECNDNGIPDECEPDCNQNGIPDDCDIAAGTSEDCNYNSIPDECEIMPLQPVPFPPYYPTGRTTRGTFESVDILFFSTPRPSPDMTQDITHYSISRPDTPSISDQPEEPDTYYGPCIPTAADQDGNCLIDDCE